MTTYERLLLCQEFVNQAEVPHRLEKQAEDNPFDMLFVPNFQEVPGRPESYMSFCTFFANAKHAYTDMMEFDLLNMMGYIEHVTRQSIMKELRSYLGCINFQLPLGSFDVNEEGTVFLRYTLPVPQEMSAELFLRQFGIAYTLMNTYVLLFLERILDIANGKRTAKSALATMQEDIDKVYQTLHDLGGRNE